MLRPRVSARPQRTQAAPARPDHATGRATDEARYFISSLPARVRRLADVARQRWQAENNLHWVLDVAFGEGRLRLRDRTAAESVALLNRLAVSLLRQDRNGVRPKAKAVRRTWRGTGGRGRGPAGIRPATQPCGMGLGLGEVRAAVQPGGVER